VSRSERVLKSDEDFVAYPDGELGRGGTFFMYAIIESGGKQQKIKAGDVLRVEKLNLAVGEKFTIDKVLVVNDGKTMNVGAPYVSGAAVQATVLSVGKSDKVIIFKFKSKKDYRKKQGHRQPYTEIEIEAIQLDGKTIAKKDAPKKKKATKKADTAAKDEAAAEDIKEEASEAEVVEETPAEEAKEEAPAEEVKEEAAEAVVVEEAPAEEAKDEAPAEDIKDEEKESAAEEKADE
jgi:large subunit ribosomal protein L21